MKNRYAIRLLFLFVAGCISLSASFAAQFTWNGSQSNLWNNTANWTPNGTPGNQDTITLNNAAHIIQLDQNRSVHRIIMNNGTINLNGFELLVTQRATFNDGAVNNGTLKLRGTFAYLQGTDFNCSVDVITGQLRLSGGVFQQAASFEQNGSASGWGEGGCVFNATVTVRNSGTAVLRMGNTQGDMFNADVNFISAGSGALQPAHQGTSSYNGNITISCTNTGGINFCNGTNGGSATIATGKTLTAGAGGLTAGVITLRNITQHGNTAQSLSTTGSSTLNIFSCEFNGSATFSAPNLLLRNNTFHQTATLTKTGNAANHWDGGNSFKGDVTISNNTTGSGILRLAVQNGDTYEGHATFQTATGFIQGAFSDTTTFMKDISINSNRVTFNNGSGWVEFGGATNQSLSGTASYQISKTIVRKSSGGLTLNKPAQVDSLLILASGKVLSDSVNLLTIGNACTVTQSGSSFIDGPLRKVGSSAFTFPIGNGLRYMPLSISSPSNTSDAFTAQFVSGLQPYGLNLDSSLMLPDSCSYWKVTRDAGTSNVKIKLGIDSSSCNNAAISNLNVASWNGTIWQNLGQGQVQGNFIESFSNSTSYIAFFLAANRMGYSCSQAIALDVDSLQADSLIALTEPEMWFKFTATSDSTMLLIGRFNEQIAALSGVYVYSGSCGNLVLIDSIIGQPIDSGWVKMLATNTGSEYYLKVAGQLSCTGCKQWFNGWYSINLTNDDGHGGSIPPCFDNNGCALGGNMGFNQLLGTFDPIAEFPFNPRSPDYNVCNWLPANASPQISNEQPYPPNSAANDVFCARLASFDRSEIIYQNIPFAAGNTYILRYFYRRQPTLPATVPGYVVSNQVDRLRVYLGTGILTNSIFSSVGNYPGVWGTTALIDEVLSINSTQWASRSVCFNPAQNFRGIAFFPTQNVPPANSFSFLNLDNMLIYRLNADAGPDRAICQGSHVALGNINNMCPVDGETFTWTPSTGLSATNIPTPVFTATSTGTFTFTLTVTDVATGCSRTDQVTVTVNGVGVAINAAPQSICSGQATTLTANVTSGQAPFSYLWSNGAVTNAINVAIAGTYTVTVTDANGCSGVDEITIIDAANPPQAIVTGSTISCVNLGVNVPYSISNFDPLNTYTWSSIPPPAGYTISPPLSVSIANIITSPPSGQQINVDFPNISGGSSNYILQVIVTDPNGCSSTTLYPVNWCCVGQGQTITWENELASNVNPLPTGSVITIRGQFIVDVNTIWNQAQVTMDPGAEIIVNPGVTFSIIGSQLEPCESFWKSITVLGGAFLILQQSKIDGAINACDIRSGGQYIINDRNVFTDNYISLRVRGRSSGVRWFYDNTITRSSIFYDVYSDYIGQVPATCHIPGDAPSHGILLEDAGVITIGGGNANTRNYIESTRIGIQAERTDLRLYNTTISALLDRPCIASGQDARTGVHTVNGASFSVFSTNVPPLNTEIVDCNNGFFISGALVDLMFNRIDQARQGIRYNNPPSHTLGIKSRINMNEIDASWRGINMRCISPVDHHTEINGNIIRDNSNGLPGGFGIGLFVEDLPSINRACNFNDNQITANNSFRIGINIINQSEFSCSENEIDLNNSTGVPVNGINVVASNRVAIKSNTINDLAQSTNSSGIRAIGIGGGAYLEDISCNEVITCQRGFNFIAPIFNLAWDRNTMNAGATGLRLENGVMLNLIEPWNKWCGSFANASWIRGGGTTLGGTLIGSQTQWTSGNCLTYPTLSQVSNINYLFFPTQIPVNEPGCPRNISNELSISNIDRLIVSDSINSLMEEHIVWQYRRLLADKLAMRPDLIETDSAISAFWHNQDNEVVQLANLSLPVLLLDSLGKENLLTAKQITDSVMQALGQLRVNDSLLFSGLSSADSLRILDENASLLTQLNTWQLLLNDLYEIARTWSDSTREVFLNNYLGFNAQTDWGNAEAEVWKLILKYGYGSELKPDFNDSIAMADYAGLCLKTYGRPVSYIRALYSYFTNIDFDDEDGCEAGARIAATRTDSMRLKEISIRPNPTMDEFTIESNFLSEEQYQVSITDLQGRIIYSQQHTGEFVNIDVQQWKAGLYFVTLNNKNERRFAQIVVFK